MKKREKKAFACIVALMWMLQPLVALASEEKIEVYNSVPFETIITQPERVDKYVTYVNGILKIEEKGMILYYSEQDYMYDTRENAIWFPEREDYSIEQFLKEEPCFKDKQEANVLEMGPFDSIRCIFDASGCEGYAGKAQYLKFFDGKDDEKFEKKACYIDEAKRYDREEETKDAMEVSYYRLMGDPWEYDGKKVKVEAVFWPLEGKMMSINQELLSHRGVWETYTINGQSAEEYYMHMAQSAERDDIQYMYAVGLIENKMHAMLECMFYLKTDLYRNSEYLGYGGIDPHYLLKNLELHEKDIPRLMELKKYR